MAGLSWPVATHADGTVVGTACERPGPSLLLVGGAEPLLAIQVAKLLQRKDFAGTLRVAANAAPVSAESVREIAAGVRGVLVVGADDGPLLGAAAPGHVGLAVRLRATAAAPLPAVVARFVLGMEELAEQLTARWPAPRRRLRVEQLSCAAPADQSASAVVALRAELTADMGLDGLVHLINRLAQQIVDEMAPEAGIEIATDAEHRGGPDGNPLLAAVSAAHHVVAGSDAAVAVPGPHAQPWAAVAPTVAYNPAADPRIDLAAAATILALSGRRFLLLAQA